MLTRQPRAGWVRCLHVPKLSSATAAGCGGVMRGRSVQQQRRSPVNKEAAKLFTPARPPASPSPQAAAASSTALLTAPGRSGRRLGRLQLLWATSLQTQVPRKCICEASAHSRLPAVCVAVLEHPKKENALVRCCGSTRGRRAAREHSLRMHMLRNGAAAGAPASCPSDALHLRQRLTMSEARRPTDPRPEAASWGLSTWPPAARSCPFLFPYKCCAAHPSNQRKPVLAAPSLPAAQATNLKNIHVHGSND